MSNVIDCREQKLVFHESVRQVLYSTRWQLVRGFSLILMRADNLRPVSQSLVARILLAARFVVSVQLTRTPRPSLGWPTTKPGPWKASWKDSPEPRPMREPILKVLLICGCRFADQQIAACGSTKVGCCGLSRRASGPLSGPDIVSSVGVVWLESDEIR